MSVWDDKLDQEYDYSSDIKNSDRNEDFAGFDRIDYPEQNSNSTNKINSSYFAYEDLTKSQIRNSVKVTDIKAEKNGQLDSYQKFVFRVELCDSNNQTVTKDFERRFSDFEVLYNYQTENYRRLQIPHLPPKFMLKNIMLTNEQLDERKKYLELFLHKQLSHKIFRKDFQMEKFMDGTIQNFKDVCSVQSGSLKKIYDVKNVVTEKAKNTYKYLGSWFSKKKEDLKIEETPSHHVLKEYRSTLGSMREQVKQITESLIKVCENASEKSEADKKISTILEDLSKIDHFVKNKTIRKMIDISQQTCDVEKQYSNDMRMSLVFYLRDCDGDLENCINKLDELHNRKLKVQNDIKEQAAYSHDDEVNPEYQDINETEKSQVSELDGFKMITNKNIKYLFEELFKISNTYNFQVADIWNGVSKKQSEIQASQNKNSFSKN